MGRAHRQINILLSSLLITYLLTTASLSAEFNLKIGLSDTYANSLNLQSFDLSNNNLLHASSQTLESFMLLDQMVAQLSASADVGKNAIFDVVTSETVTVDAYYSEHQILIDITSFAQAGNTISDGFILQKFASHNALQIPFGTNGLTPLSMNISANITCSCLEAEFNHAPMDGHISWPSTEAEIQVLLNHVDSTIPLSLDMALRPRPTGQIPIIISDGNAHLLNHNQISDFEGIFCYRIHAG